MVLRLILVGEDELKITGNFNIKQLD